MNRWFKKHKQKLAIALAVLIAFLMVLAPVAAFFAS